jgi:RNA polymerase sigma factor (sigma-70 family)
MYDLDALWAQYERFFKMKAREFFYTHPNRCVALGIEISDLEQQAFFALLEAVRTFDPDRGFKFITWLVYPLKKRFNELVKLRTPGQKSDPTLIPEYLDAPVSEGVNLTLGDTIPDPDSDKAMQRIDDMLTLSKLPDKQRDVLELRYLAGLPWKVVADVCDTTVARVKFFGKQGLEMARALD